MNNLQPVLCTDSPPICDEFHWAICSGALLHIVRRICRKAGGSLLSALKECALRSAESFVAQKRILFSLQSLFPSISILCLSVPQRQNMQPTSFNNNNKTRYAYV